MKNRTQAPHEESADRDAWLPPHEKHLLGELLHAYISIANIFPREVGITLARQKLLHELMHTGLDGVGLGDLALRLHVTPALITRQIKEMERDGLVRRRNDARDGRRSFVHLTPAGGEEVSRFHARAHSFESVLIDGIDPKDLNAAIRVLNKLNDKLGSWKRSGRRLVHTDRLDAAV
jgi:MarR family transcriptional regulator, transcriptional regulator for hemolysin